MPEITVIIPFFNSEKSLSRAIDSVVNQSYTNWELVLINDGSTDRSEEMVKPFLLDTRIVYLSQYNRGVSAARNYGACKATGDWLIFLDSDDRLKSGILTEMNNQLKYCNTIDCLIFGINRINGNKNQEKLPKDGEYSSKIPGTFLIRNKLFRAVGGYDERFRFSENTELFHRIYLSGARVKNISLISLDYFDNPNGGSKNLQNMVVSLLIFLEKHDKTLTNHVKHLFHQIIGVNQMRFQEFGKARSSLFLSLKFKPYQIGTWGRFGISFFPFLAKRFYGK
jgi:glycosyltransferase involved in cell wall biosynthesis